MTHPDLDIHPEVVATLARGGAVVALESTIIAHGMPYPGNLETGIELERQVRLAGAVPATIAVFDGRLKVGLESPALERLARSNDVAKASVRDLPILMASGRDGATTVASTMRVAAMAGIRVFATGGIGGVHRGAEATGDVSADLPELAKSRVAVVSAGAKAILDLPRTLEMLDTLSVPVIGHETGDFPAFYSRKSGLPVSVRVDSPSDIAAILVAHWRLPGSGGVLIANPIPAADEIPATEIEAHIVKALAEADAQKVSGKDVTPFLLARIRDLTGGRSQRANVSLALNNARLGGRVAAALARQDGPR